MPSDVHEVYKHLTAYVLNTVFEISISKIHYEYPLTDGLRADLHVDSNDKTTAFNIEIELNPLRVDEKIKKYREKNLKINAIFVVPTYRNALEVETRAIIEDILDQISGGVEHFSWAKIQREKRQAYYREVKKKN